MNFLRKILFPFAILYDFITSIRNFLFDFGILKSYSFPIPVIAVGNLSVGGTGKTPQIEYLTRLLSHQYQIATLSRGYKRKSEGFVLANETSNAEILGDEPFQFYKKFPNIQVAVDANRKNGIEQLLSSSNKPDIILLDDAFQHRKVKAGFYILLTAYNDLFINDFMLPTGNLRESRSGAKRATIIIVTKCPRDISEAEQTQIKERIGVDKTIFFTFIDYDDKIYSNNKTLNVNDVKTVDKLLVAGIAKPESFFAYLQSENDECLVYPDHHHFSEKDIIDIKEKAKNKIIITTEKDFVRLSEKLKNDNLFYLPIKSSFVNNGDDFDKKIINYVGASTTNG
ncbi:tetraacyldisaccharide 4'-kinase [Flavobacterium sp.]|uniref:tetraacyldisaccharide 4'-kinase n=1 Tax=Flavobacterium sp. TaxID=239 RepID=UPI0037521168